MSALQQVLSEKIIAIVRLDDYASAVDVARALAAGGIRVLEFTLTGRGALEAHCRHPAGIGRHGVRRGRYGAQRR